MFEGARNRITDSANPIMIKSLYQGVHSKAFVAAFWGLLVIALIGYYVSYVAERHGAVGEAMFSVFAVLLTLMTNFMIPFLAFNNLYGEVVSRTLELVQITGISPARLVRGAWWAAMTQNAFVFSVIAPFAVACYLFGGVDLTLIIMILYIIFICSLATSALGIAFASQAAYKGMLLLSRWGYFVASSFGLIITFPLAGEVYDDFSRHPPPMDEGILIFGGVTLLSLLSVFLLLGAAQNALTFLHNRSSSRQKVMVWLIIVAGFLFILAAVLTGELSRLDEIMILNQSIGSAFLFLCCIFWIVSPMHLTQEQMKKYRRLGRVRRCLYYPFLDGSLSTAIYLVISLVLVSSGSLVFYGLMELDLVSGLRVGKFDVFIGCAVYSPVLTLAYVIYFFAAACLIARLLPERMRTPGTKMIIIVALLSLSLLVLFFLIAAWDTNRGLSSYPMAFVPLAYLFTLSDPSVGVDTVLLQLIPPFLLGCFYLIYHSRGERRRFKAELRMDPVEEQAT